MAHTRHVTTRSPRYALGSADAATARVVVLLLLVVPVLVAVVLVSVQPRDASETARQIASFNPRSLFSEEGRRFLPPPVAAIPPEQDAGPPVPAAGEPAANAARVKVADTGGVGAVLRAAPRTGRQVAALRDGQVLEVLERQAVDDDVWLRVRTQNGVEGWVYGRLVGPAD